MKAFLITVLIALVLVAGGFWYAQQNPDKLPAEVRDQMEVGQDTRAPARGPQDYHILQDQGGIPRAEAERAGLVTADHAYLSALEAVKQDTGVEAIQSARVNGKLYDFAFIFNTTPPEMQVLEYNVQGKWDSLTFGFGFSDDEASDPTGRFQIELSVLGDGRELMTPVTISPVDLPYFTELDVKDFRRISFVSKRVGHGNTFAPILLDPFVKMEDSRSDGE